MDKGAIQVLITQVSAQVDGDRLELEPLEQAVHQLQGAIQVAMADSAHRVLTEMMRLSRMLAMDAAFYRVAQTPELRAQRCRDMRDRLQKLQRFVEQMP